MNDSAIVLQGEVAIPSEYQLSWIRQAFGDKLIPLICLPTNMPRDMLEEFRKTFPESIVVGFNLAIAIAAVGSVVSLWPSLKKIPNT